MLQLKCTLQHKVIPTLYTCFNLLFIFKIDVNINYERVKFEGLFYYDNSFERHAIANSSGIIAILRYSKLLACMQTYKKESQMGVAGTTWNHKHDQLSYQCYNPRQTLTHTVSGCFHLGLWVLVHFSVFFDWPSTITST